MENFGRHAVAAAYEDLRYDHIAKSSNERVLLCDCSNRITHEV